MLLAACDVLGDVLGKGSGRMICVDAGFDGASDGSPAKPYKRIQEAVDAAKNGDTIGVAEGRYEHGNVDLKGKALKLLGGFPGKGDFSSRDPKKHVTVVVGKKETPDYKKDPGAVFLWADSAGGTIDGFTITGGRHGVFSRYTGSSEPLVISNNVIEGNGLDKPTYEETGGGIHSEYKSLVVRGNVIRKNRSGRGAGLAAFGQGEAKIEENVIEENVTLGDHGGGVYLQQSGTFRANVVRKNEVTAELVSWMAGVGGGVTIIEGKVSMSENLIHDNYAKKCGGGVFVDDGATVTMEHDLVVQNRPPHADGWGGAGIYVDGGGEKSTHLTIKNTTVADNAPAGPGQGNGIFLASKAEVTVVGSVFFGNGMKDELAVVDDTGSSWVDVSHSLIKTAAKGVKVGAGVFAAEPLFADPKSLDYHPRSKAGRWDPKAGGGAGGWVTDDVTSPCIDAADPALPIGQEPVPNGARVNLGRHGGTAEASKSTGEKSAEPTPAPSPSSSAAPTDDPSFPAAGSDAPPARGCSRCTVGSQSERPRAAWVLAVAGLAAGVWRSRARSVDPRKDRCFATGRAVGKAPRRREKA